MWTKETCSTSFETACKPTFFLFLYFSFFHSPFLFSQFLFFSLFFLHFLFSIFLLCLSFFFLFLLKLAWVLWSLDKWLSKTRQHTSQQIYKSQNLQVVVVEIVYSLKTLSLDNFIMLNMWNMKCIKFNSQYACLHTLMQDYNMWSWITFYNYNKKHVRTWRNCLM